MPTNNKKDTKSRNKFYEKLKTQKSELHDFLTSDEIQRQINSFYPIRDSLQHREMLRGIMTGSPTENISVFELNEEDVTKIIKEIDNPPFLVEIYKNHFCLDSFSFIVWAQEVLIKVVNGVLSLIDWDSVVKSLPEDIQREISESHREFEAGVGNFLRLGDEPWYF